MAYSETLKKSYQDFYDQVAPFYGLRRNEVYAKYVESQMDQFAQSVKKSGDWVLDLGSGPGNDSLELKRRGLEVVCVDISAEMVNACKAKGLLARQMDFYDLDFPVESLDGVWMAFSLLHVPKNEAGIVLEQVWRVLKKGGTFYVGLFEGEGEKNVPSVGAPGTDHKIFKAFYHEDEIVTLLSRFFEVTNRSFLPNPMGATTMFFECKK